MRFKDWLLKEEGFVSKSKVQDSRFKPGPRDIKPKPHDLRLCGIAGGPGPGGACAGGASGGIAAPAAS
jgi:hypothetical protein